MTWAAFPYSQPLHGLVGGIMIGLAAAMMLLGAGRIAGVSGITARATGLGSGSMALTSAWGFLAGLPLGAVAVVWMLGGRATAFAPWPIMVISGLLVGFGTRMGSGCTSGHGVCGISRLSPRSILATATFVAAGVITVGIMSLLGSGA